MSEENCGRNGWDIRQGWVSPPLTWRPPSLAHGIWDSRSLIHSLAIINQGEESLSPLFFPQWSKLILVCDFRISNPHILQTSFPMRPEMFSSSMREISAFTQNSFKIFCFCHAFGNFFNLFSGGSSMIQRPEPHLGPCLKRQASS